MSINLCVQLINFYDFSYNVKLILLKPVMKSWAQTYQTFHDLKFNKSIAEIYFIYYINMYAMKFQNNCHSFKITLTLNEYKSRSLFRE